MHITDYGNDENILEKYGRNLIEEVKKGKMDPIIGRDEEIRNVIMILSRKTKGCCLSTAFFASSTLQKIENVVK